MIGAKMIGNLHSSSRPARWAHKPKNPIISRSGHGEHLIAGGRPGLAEFHKLCLVGFDSQATQPFSRIQPRTKWRPGNTCRRYDYATPKQSIEQQAESRRDRGNPEFKPNSAGLLASGSLSWDAMEAKEPHNHEARVKSGSDSRRDFARSATQQKRCDTPKCVYALPYVREFAAPGRDQFQPKTTLLRQGNTCRFLSGASMVYQSLSCPYGSTVTKRTKALGANNPLRRPILSQGGARQTRRPMTFNSAGIESCPCGHLRFINHNHGETAACQVGRGSLQGSSISTSLDPELSQRSMEKLENTNVTLIPATPSRGILMNRANTLACGTTLPARVSNFSRAVFRFPRHPFQIVAP